MYCTPHTVQSRKLRPFEQSAYCTRRLFFLSCSMSYPVSHEIVLKQFWAHLGHLIIYPPTLQVSYEHLLHTAMPTYYRLMQDGNAGLINKLSCSLLILQCPLQYSVTHFVFTPFSVGPWLSNLVCVPCVSLLPSSWTQ